MTKPNIHTAYHYPVRCEYVGCTKTTGLKPCQSCGVVQYCSRDHLIADMDKHDSECDVLCRNNVRPIYYTDEEMLAKYPIQTRKSKRELKRHLKRKNLKEMGCDVCGSKTNDLMITECCHLVICDTEKDYVMFSYSRDLCSRSHNRYTHCGYHSVENYCDKEKDWRECDGCAQGLRENKIGDYLWRGLNGYNTVPLLEKNVPKHALCDVCSDCKEPFMSGLEGFSYKNGIVCLPCSGIGIQ